MNFKVDIKNLNLELKNLNYYIEKYNDNSYDIFFELSKLSSYWKDKYSVFFNDKIKNDKQNMLFVLQNINKFNSLYKEIEKIYNISKIEFNSQNKVKVINQINNCIDEMKDINNIHYNTIIPNNFYYKGLFDNLKGNIEKNINNIVAYKEDFNMYTNNINKNEIELLSKINGIEEIIIDEF